HRVGCKADAPASHRPGLRGTVGNDGALVQAGYLGDGEEGTDRIWPIYEAGVDLVRVDPDLRMRLQYRPDALQLLPGQTATGRVMRVIEDEKLGARIQQPPQFIWIEREAALLVQVDRHRLGAIGEDLRLVNWEAGVGIDNFVARAVMGG